MPGLEKTLKAMKKLNPDFFQQDVLKVAPELPGKYLICNNKAFLITEVEAYRGAEDRACHASKGRTVRTEIMYHEGGHVYVYLIYGMYWMLNVVTAPKDTPQAVLFRGIEGFNGPGKLTRHLGIDRSYYGEHVCYSDRIWIGDPGTRSSCISTPRIGINYAGSPWTKKPWRFVLERDL